MPDKPATQNDVTTYFVFTVIIILMYSTLIGVNVYKVKQTVQRIEPSKALHGG